VHLLPHYLATYASSGRTFNNHFTANLLENLPVKK